MADDENRPEGEGEEGEGGGAQKNKRLQQTQAQVDEVVGIMKLNIEKVLERDHKLGQLDDRADKLQEGANQFKSQAAAMKNAFWLKNLKMIIIMVILSLIGLLILYVYLGGHPVDDFNKLTAGSGDGGEEGGGDAAGDGGAEGGKGGDGGGDKGGDAKTDAKGKDGGGDKGKGKMRFRRFA